MILPKEIKVEDTPITIANYPPCPPSGSDSDVSGGQCECGDCECERKEDNNLKIQEDEGIKNNEEPKVNESEGSERPIENHCDYPTQDAEDLEIFRNLSEYYTKKYWEVKDRIERRKREVVSNEEAQSILNSMD